MADYEIDSNVRFDTPIASTVAFATPVVADVTARAAGLEDMNLTLAGGTTTTVAGETTANVKVDLRPVSTKVTLAPVTTDSTVRSDTAINLEPVAVDSCVRVEFGPLPATQVCTPYQQRWRLEVLGVEIVALGLEGTSSMNLRPAQSRPSIVDL